MDPLAVIENRIEELECKLGYSPEDEYEKNAVEQMTHAESILSNTISGREKISDINQRLDELNSYLDPQYVNQINDSKLKLNYILTNEQSLQHYCESMQLCQEKSSVLDSEAIASIPTLNKTLEKLKLINIENKDQSDQVEHCVLQAMETYNQVSLSVMESLAAISKKIDTLSKNIS